jgi:hypothetical protein
VTEARVEAHLAGFATSFVRPKFRARWRHILLERPAKAAAQLRKFEGHLDPRRCRLVDNAADVLHTIPESTRGLYFDGQDSPRFVSLDDALFRSGATTADAIFSISPGEHAVFFFHEGWAWVCEKSPQPRSRAEPNTGHDTPR